MVAGFRNECPYYALFGREMSLDVVGFARWGGLLLALHRFEELGIGFRVLHFVK